MRMHRALWNRSKRSLQNANLWVTGALGLAVAYDRYEVAIALSLVTYLTLQLIPTIKEKAS